MRYNIMAISDIHWGCINPKEQMESLEFVFTFLDEAEANDLHIDLIVIVGDYFDAKLSLNGEETIYGFNWFHRLYKLCIERKIKLRVLQGTMDHDNYQLENLLGLQDEEGMLRIFLQSTMEETLPGLLCCYCPDEMIETSEYESKNMDMILQLKDLGFFHGSFDIVYGDLLDYKPELVKKNNVMYNYNLISGQIKGPLIAGHWHDGQQYGELYYCGSPFRWTFNEDNPKGFLFIQYDTENSSYYIEKILNPVCGTYLTYEIFTNAYYDQKDYVKIIEEIQDILGKLRKIDKLRILVYINDEKSENDVLLSSLRQKIIGHKNCKITIKNKIKDKKKKEKAKDRKEEESKYRFIFGKNDPAEVIKEFLDITDGEPEVPFDFIKEKVKKYI